MNKVEIRRRLADYCSEAPLSDQQLGLLVKFSRLYEQRGLIEGGKSPPLWQCCPRHEECWTPKKLRFRPTGRHGAGGIPLPWIGPDYDLGGVVVVAVNLRDASGLKVEYDITCNSEKSQIGVLAGRGMKPHKSWLAYGSARTAGMLLDMHDAVAVTDREASELLPEVLKRTARLQAVKCSPRDGDNSKPSEGMWGNCPDLLLARELDLLQPSYILAVGQAHRAVRSLDGFRELPSRRRRIREGTLDGHGWSARVFAIAHPMRQGLWRQDHDALLRMLRAR